MVRETPVESTSERSETLAPQKVIRLLGNAFCDACLLSSVNASHHAKKGRTMQFRDFICVEAIRPDLQADGEYDAIQELVEALADAGEVDERHLQGLVDAIEVRERLGTTALGHDAAIPHAKHPAAGRCVGTLGISRHGIEFHSIDREKVHIVFLVVSPPNREAEHVEALGQIARHLRDETFCRFLKESRTGARIQQLLEETDNR